VQQLQANYLLPLQHQRPVIKSRAHCTRSTPAQPNICPCWKGHSRHRDSSATGVCLALGVVDCASCLDQAAFHPTLMLHISNLRASLPAWLAACGCRGAVPPPPASGAEPQHCSGSGLHKGPLRLGPRGPANRAAAAARGGGGGILATAAAAAAATCKRPYSWHGHRCQQ
jgi:hypothetical protein